MERQLSDSHSKYQRRSREIFLKEILSVSSEFYLRIIIPATPNKTIFFPLSYSRSFAKAYLPSSRVPTWHNHASVCSEFTCLC